MLREAVAKPHRGRKGNMPTHRIIEQLKAGNVAAVIAALEEEQREFEEWCVREEEEQRLSWAVARELNSSPETLEEVAW